MEQVIYKNDLHFTRTLPHNICSVVRNSSLGLEQFFGHFCGKGLEPTHNFCIFATNFYPCNFDDFGMPTRDD